MDVFANERLVEFLNVDSTRDLEEFVISQYFHILASDVSNGRAPLRPRFFTNPFPNCIVHYMLYIFSVIYGTLQAALPGPAYGVSKRRFDMCI